MVEADIEEVIRCFESCYGRTYIQEFYDPEWMRDQIRRGLMRSVVAVDEGAGVVGHMALKVVHEGSLACEAGSTVVHPDFRKLGLMSRMGTMITDLCVSEGFVGIVNEPTTAHEIMQRRSTEGGGVETGLMLELVPADTEFHDFEVRAGRTAVTVVYHPLAPAPAREVYVPAVYRSLVEELYTAIGLERTVVEAAADSGAVPTKSVASESISEQHRLRRWFVGRVGQDLADLVDAKPPTPVEVSQVDLCLDDPGVESATAALRERGFFYSALQPEFARTDLLRLQRLESPGPEAFSPLLVNEGARRLLAMMIADQAGELD